MSSTSAGSTPARWMAWRATWPDIAGASVSLKAPRKALPIGVRATETMTASRKGMLLMLGPRQR